MSRLALILSAALTPLVPAADPDPPPKMTLERILKTCPKDEDALEKLFQMTLERKPTAEESRRLLAFVRDLSKRTRAEAYGDAHWAITNSKEYLTRQKEKGKAKAGKQK